MTGIGWTSACRDDRGEARQVPVRVAVGRDPLVDLPDPDPIPRDVLGAASSRNISHGERPPLTAKVNRPLASIAPRAAAATDLGGAPRDGIGVGEHLDPGAGHDPSSSSDAAGQVVERVPERLVPSSPELTPRTRLDRRDRLARLGHEPPPRAVSRTTSSRGSPSASGTRRT